MKHETRTKSTRNPDIAMSAEPSVTIIEPSLDILGQDVLSVLTEWASTEAASSFIAYRKKHKARALSLTAAKRTSRHLKAIFNNGGDADDALGMAEERGWATVEADWYFKAKGNHGNGNRGGQSESPGDRQLRLIAIAARSV
jgi:hypothetical protein